MVRWIGLAVVPLLTAGCTSQGATPQKRVYYTGPVSDHFNGETFFNPEGDQGSGGAKAKGKKDFLARALGKGARHDWPKSVPVKQTVPAARVEGQAMRVTWIGHATALIQTEGLNILLDPVWAHRDSPVQFVGPKRVRAPGVRLEDLPRIDLILLSHNHYDHLDIGAMKQIAARDRPLIVTGLGNDALLADHKIPATARDWGQRVTVRPGIDVILNRAHHWSAHWTDDHDRSLWTGFTITLPGGNLYYAGDTGPGDMAWAHGAKKSAPIRLAILPIGPYNPDGEQTGNHIGPAEAAAAFKLIGPHYALGVHWGTFELSAEPIDGPPTLLAQENARLGVAPDRFRTLDPGVAWDVPAISR